MTQLCLVGPAITPELPTDPAPDSTPASGYSSPLACACAPRSEGPTLPEMERGLPNTPLERIQLMFAYVLVNGLRDHDDAWIRSRDFLTVAEYAGLEGATPQRVRDLYFSGKMDMRRLCYTFNGYEREAVAA